MPILRTAMVPFDISSSAPAIAATAHTSQPAPASLHHHGRTTDAEAVLFIGRWPGTILLTNPRYLTQRSLWLMGPSRNNGFEPSTYVTKNHPHPAGPPAPSRPVVKRKRTGGNLGAFKTLPSISNPSSAASRGTPPTAHSSQGIPQKSTNTVPCPPPSASSAPSAPSTARSGDHPHQAVQSKPPQSSTFFWQRTTSLPAPREFRTAAQL